ncbi:MAG: 16S rRNA (uracil(1498)-N(3))-methyltransferase [Firmicutes bacterium]|jgi:16S rRNA (uracil1498-N3)-methyltransferase|nr:16S rRNA (uracil(1498)-N(3))-methyltransferase [Bacillota bacterium]
MSFWFFLSPESFQERVVLPGDILQHLKALRLKAGDIIVLSDGEGRAFYARLDYIRKEDAAASLLGEVETEVEPPLEVTLYPGITKGEKLDEVIRHAVELGVRRIAPVLTGRSVVKYSEKKGREKAARWQKIAFSAASQCRRRFVPRVEGPLSFDDMLHELASGREEIIIIPWEGEKERGFAQLARDFPEPPRALAIFTGPEGGISPSEMEKLRQCRGVRPVTLGTRILRAETAPLAVLSIVMYLWGDLGG